MIPEKALLRVQERVCILVAKAAKTEGVPFLLPASREGMTEQMVEQYGVTAEYANTILTSFAAHAAIAVVENAD